MSWNKEDMMEVTRELKMTGTVSGTAKHALTMFYNAPVVLADWVTTNTNGSATLACNKSGSHIMYPLSGLKEGDILTKYRVLGGCTGVATDTVTTIDAALWKNTKTAGAVAVATSLGAITQISAEEATSIDSEKDITDVTVADDYQYFVLVKGTTNADTGCTAMLTGVELDISRIV